MSNQNRTSSFWIEEGDQVRLKGFRSTPSLPKSAKIIVIGGGITGASCGYWITKLAKERGEQIDVVLLEMNDSLCEGATGRNGGHIWPSLKVPQKAHVERFGLEQMQRAFHSEFETLELVKHFVEEQQKKTGKNECQFYVTGGVDLVQKEEEAKEVKETVRQLKALGLGKGAEFWDAEKCQKETFSPKYKGGLYQANATQLWPAKLVEMITREAVANGLKVYTKVKVEKVENPEKSHERIVHTSEGVILADYVVYATNAYTSRLIPELKDIIVPTRGQIVVTSPVKSFQWKMSVAQYDWEYLIQRREDRRIVCGGMRWKSPNKEVGVEDDTTVSSHVGEGLREYLLETFPSLKEEEDFKIEKEWTGIMGFSADYLPLIGPLPYSAKELLVAGFTGHGMPKAFGAGKMIAEMIYGTLKPEHYIQPFLPSRFPQLHKPTPISVSVPVAKL